MFNILPEIDVCSVTKSSVNENRDLYQQKKQKPNLQTEMQQVQQLLVAH